jgi:hypothetical protein
MRGRQLTEVPDEAWESDDCVYRTMVMPAALAERLATRAEQRGLSVSELLTEYAEEGLRRDPQALAGPAWAGRHPVEPARQLRDDLSPVGLVQDLTRVR